VSAEALAETGDAAVVPAAVTRTQGALAEVGAS